MHRFTYTYRPPASKSRSKFPPTASSTMSFKRLDIYVYVYSYLYLFPSLAARYLEKKTRRFLDFFRAPSFLFPRVNLRLTRG